MGRTGPAPKPTHLKVLEGFRESRINRDEPISGDGEVRPAVPLDADAQAVWDRLAPNLIAKQVLTAWEVDIFAAFCNATALYYRASAKVSSAPLEARTPAFRAMTLAEATIRATGHRFGLTPADRRELQIHTAEDRTGSRFIT